MATYLNGIDVSHWQGSVDWSKVAGADIHYAFAKASDGTSGGDSQFDTNWTGMKSAGLLRGAYAFYEVGSDPKAQAQNFINRVTLDSGDLPPVVDIETEKSGAESDANLVRDLHSYIDTIKQHYGMDPIIYTGPGFWNGHFDNSFSDCPLWVAEYGVSAPKPVTGWKVWSFWQHSQNGKVSGVSGDVDLDYFNGSIEQLRKFTKS